MISFVAYLLAAAQWNAPGESWRLANPKAIELFERDERLMRWALRFHDSNEDGHLSILEADRASLEFKRIADGDIDGQVTPTEYRQARDFIAARWSTD